MKILLSFDLSTDGDYQGLYTWLDNNNAVECGTSCAQIDLKSKKGLGKPWQSLIKDLQNDIKKNVKIKDGLFNDRIHVTFKTNNEIKSGFLFGKRKKAPWSGYAINSENDGRLELNE
ncbi:MAG: hypothetical protein ACTSXL_01040 [Alphaproteobacteria bacterium]|nr:MAG: hypothetical protein B6I23_02080 [Rickettsiaceae bacterium 4572_127]